MMKRRTMRSRKYRVDIPFPTILALFLVCVTIFGLSYLLVCARCDTLGQEIKRLETVQKETYRLLNNEQDRWSSQLSPASLERALARHKLAMSLPSEHQIVRVRISAVDVGNALAYNP